MTIELQDSEALVVLGSLNARPFDRRHSRDQIEPCQVVIGEEVHPVPAFRNVGEFGMSSMAWADDGKRGVACDGHTLYAMDLVEHSCWAVTIDGLLDVHEITMIEDGLWLANTGRDEVVELEWPTLEARNCIRLAQHRAVSEPQLDANEEIRDTFHCNQIFVDPTGMKYALVHHVTGQQHTHRIADRLVKIQGDGGVINLETGAVHNLQLRAPHTARLVGDEWWMFDSLNYVLAVFDQDWTQQETIRTSGLGRGAAWSPIGNVFYAGISETRRRYRNLLRDRRSAGKNMVEVFSVDSREKLGDIELENIEQVNNIYLVSDTIARALCRLSAPSMRMRDQRSVLTEHPLREGNSR